MSLAFSNVGVGLIVQPFYTWLLAKWLQQSNPSCVTYRAYTAIGVSLSPLYSLKLWLTVQIDFLWFIFISDTRSLWLTNVFLFWRSLYDCWVHFYRCSCFCQIFITYFYPVAILSFWDAMKTKFTPCKKVRWHRIAAANCKSLRFVHSTLALSK